jgi:hypothetical protein
MNSKNFSLALIVVMALGFLYVVYKAGTVVMKRQIGTSSGVYTHKVTISHELQMKAKELSQGCQSRLCRVQHMLDYVTQIPYRINHFQAHRPQVTIDNNFGDCDDKSNLLISLLHAEGIEAYFVLVPEHIFIIVPLVDERLADRNALQIDGRKYYILESTATDSLVGYPLQYQVEEIEAIIDPLDNERLEYHTLYYKS